MSLKGSAKSVELRGAINRMVELRGYSAYEIAVIHGFEGTEAEWIASALKGERGEPGINGKDGANGKDGYTPIKGVDYFDGANGKDGYTPIKGVDYSDGKDGANGKDGYTPIKGKDYFDGKDGKDYVLTSSDKTEIANIVLAELPVAEDISV